MSETVDWAEMSEDELLEVLSEFLPLVPRPTPSEDDEARL
jgi:hypothetical protein